MGHGSYEPTMPIPVDKRHPVFPAANLYPAVLHHNAPRKLQMARFHLAIVFALLREAVASQYPLPATSIVSQTLPLVKDLVDSESLQARIHADNLLERAKTLYSIAKLGEAEYNHPTRVIGSEGITLTFQGMNSWLTRLQDTSAPLITSTQASPN